jgi:hypothetical protein
MDQLLGQALVDFFLAVILDTSISPMLLKTNWNNSHKLVIPLLLA